MSVDYTAKVIIGFEVKHSDFWTTKTTTNTTPTCPACGITGVEGTYCVTHGQLITARDEIDLVPTPAFQAYYDALVAEPKKPGKEYVPDPCEIWNYDAPTHNLEEQACPAYLGGLELYAGEDGGYDEVAAPNVLVLGTEMGTMTEERNVIEAFTEAQEIANALGIDRPTFLWVTTRSF